MQYKECEFYGRLLELIDKDLKEKSLKPIDLLKVDYIIGRTQYYNMKKIAEGNKTISRLSHNRLMGLCDYLGVNLNEMLFDADMKYTK